MSESADERRFVFTGLGTMTSRALSPADAVGLDRSAGSPRVIWSARFPNLSDLPGHRTPTDDEG